MFEISVDYTFAAGHALRNYKGKCENVHGHNYKVRVTLAGDKLNGDGLLMDFVELRAELKRLVEKLDHHFLNDIPPFDELNPSAENLASMFAARSNLGQRVRVCRCRALRFGKQIRLQPRTDRKSSDE